MIDLNTKLLLEKIQDGVILYDSTSTVSFVNSSALEILKMQEQELLGKKFDEIGWKLLNASGNELKKEHYPAYSVALNDNNIVNRIIGIADNNSVEPIWMLMNAYKDDDNVVVTFTDVTHKYTQAFNEIVENAIDGVVITKADNIDKPSGPEIIYINDHIIELTGYTKEELVGNTPRIFQGENTCKESMLRIRKALEEKSPIREVMLNYKKSGEAYWADVSIFPLSLAPDDTITHFCSIQKDITEIKKAEEESAKNAQKDHLTGLLNRRGLSQVCDKFAADQSFSIIMIDVDHFKNINDNYSHKHGDQVLVALAKNIQLSCRSQDLAVRLGGEEFAIILLGSTKNQALQVAERLRKQIGKQVLSLDGQIINCTISCGLADSNDAKDVNKCIEYADEALYKAKKSGRNQSVVYA
ncbi:hypothetical protein LO80_03955 [Candidatus Francisella endociliophora]|uniref:Diguanylate cyclase n=1 Tax=Candidatus Francisella endociliophora TaxID=653937 RepID=A0A097ENS0_9GAMM|nr:sensor domain-containing diguanylate cyclase [Francisella sp. FSC1006]AIT09209.1 hypothetical protein LO80_03955 [Francisella sp. FSC1006]